MVNAIITNTKSDYLDRRKKEIGSRIQQARKSNKLSQSDVAEFLNCSRLRITRAENGHTEFSIGEIELLAAEFGVNPLELLGVSISYKIENGLPTS